MVLKFSTTTPCHELSEQLEKFTPSETSLATNTDALGSITDCDEDDSSPDDSSPDDITETSRKDASFEKALCVLNQQLGDLQWAQHVQKEDVRLLMGKADIELQKALVFITRKRGFSVKLRTELHEKKYGYMKHGDNEHFHRHSLHHYFLSGMKDVLQYYVFSGQPIVQALEIASPPKYLKEIRAQHPRLAPLFEAAHISHYWATVESKIKDTCSLQLEKWFKGCHSDIMTHARYVIESALLVRRLLLFSNWAVVYGCGSAIHPKTRERMQAEGTVAWVEALPAVIILGRRKALHAGVICHSRIFRDDFGQRDCRWCRERIPCLIDQLDDWVVVDKESAVSAGFHY